MKRIVNFGFQALKQIIDLTVLRKCAQKTTNITTPKNMLSDSLLSFLQSHCKKAKTKDDYSAKNIPLESAHVVFLY